MKVEVHFQNLTPLTDDCALVIPPLPFQLKLACWYISMDAAGALETEAPRSAGETKGL